MFYCKKCLPEHKSHSDRSLHSLCRDIEEELQALRIKYLTKKETLVSKVNTHLSSMEGIFKIYYDTLDKLRAELLKDEYSYLKKMDNLESNLKKLV